MHIPFQQLENQKEGWGKTNESCYVNNEGTMWIKLFDVGKVLGPNEFHFKEIVMSTIISLFSSRLEQGKT